METVARVRRSDRQGLSCPFWKPVAAVRARWIGPVATFVFTADDNPYQLFLLGGWKTRSLDSVVMVLVPSPGFPIDPDVVNFDASGGEVPKAEITGIRERRPLRSQLR